MSKKDPKAKVCSHYTYEGDFHLNKALHEIWSSTHVKPCQFCSKDSGIPESSETNKKKKKKKKKASTTTTTTTKVVTEIWVCLTCRGHFCGSAQNHIRTHTQETGHWWATKNNDTSSIYCFQCNREVLNWSPEDHKEVAAQIELRFVIAGLKTLGRQSCFNAVLQNLLSLYPLRKEILGAEFPRTARIAIALRELFVRTNTLMRHSLHVKTGTAVRTKLDEDVNPSTLLSQMVLIDPDFRSRDSEETFRCFLSALNEDEKEAWAGAHEIVHSTLVNSVFGGECSIIASCSECSEWLTEEQRFFHLSLPFVRSTDVDFNVSIEECLKAYTDPQPWICKKCTEAGYNKDNIRKGRHLDGKTKGFGAGTRRIWISRTPQVLAFHLKRNESDDQSKKLKIRVNPQDKLHIGPFMDPSCGVDCNITYRLVGVVQYDKTSGHVANVKAISYQTPVSQWFEAIDLQVKKKALKSVEGEPHLLFYRQVLDKDNPLQKEKSEKVITDGGVVKKGKEPAPLGQIGGKIPPSAEVSHPMETHVGLPNLPWLVEESDPIENLSLPVEGSLPQENFPVPFEGSDPIEICANVIKPLPNLGNTCFFNAVLQNLLALDSLRSKMLGPDIPTGPLISSLRDLFIQTSPLCHAPVTLDPKNILTTIFELCPRLERGRQEDSHEFLSVFLDQLEMEEEVKALKPVDTDTIVNSLFRGSVSNTISSMQCPHDSIAPEEKFLAMLLYIPEGILKVSIEELWASYTNKVELSIGWPCSDCKAPRNAKRQILVVKAPPVLIVTLNNYEFISSTETKKLEANVHFKELFDIGPFMKERPVGINTFYQLVGVIEHEGAPAGGAHYTAYVRANKMEGLKQHSNTKSWFYASDRHIGEATLDEVLGCKPYMLFYERCAADFTSDGSQLATNTLPQFSANPRGKESHADSNMQPPTDASVSGSSLALQDGVLIWEYQRTKNLSRKARNKLDQVNNTVGQRVGVFLDRYILQGDTKPFYHCELVTMCERGSGSRELNVHYSHLLNFSKDLAMDVCNGYARLMFYLKEAAINFAKKLAGLVRDGHLILTNTARKRLELLGSVNDMDSSLELKFLEMPKVHRLLKYYLSYPLTQEMYVYGNYQQAIRTPIPAKCSLLQRLFADVIAGHRVGLSWNGMFTVDDIEFIDDKVFIAKEPKQFSIDPVISLEMIHAMENDFFKIAKLVLLRFRYGKDAILGNFRTTGAYVPYLETFYNMFRNLNTYVEWWAVDEKAEGLRNLIQHHPFLKPALARSNLWSGIFSANRSHDTGDRSVLFKKILETHVSTHGWFPTLYNGGNRMIQCIVEHKDKSLVVPPAAAEDDVTAAAEDVTVAAEDDVTAAAAAEDDVTAAAEDVTTAAAAEDVTAAAAEDVTAALAPDPANPADPAEEIIFSHYGEPDEFLFEIMRYLAHHGSAHSLLRRGGGPRIQLMQSLEEPELAASLFVEGELVKALTELLKKSAMKGLLKAVWDCYKNCNHPHGP